MQKHNPTPWRQAYDESHGWNVIDAAYDPVAHVLGPDSVAEANIEFITEAVNDHDHLRDTIRSYGETIVQLNEAAQRSELEAMRLRDLLRRLSDCILGAHLDGLDGPFHAADGLDACPNITDDDGMEVLNGDIAEALTVLAQAQAILREARETTGKEEP